MKRRHYLSWLVIMLFALSLAACAPANNNTSDVNQSENSVSDDSVFNWSKESDCGTCHLRDVESFTDSACLAAEHPDLASNCFLCHNQENELEAVHEKVEMGDEKKKDTLKKTSVSEEICLSCHQQEDCVTATATSEVLTDKNGLTINPHDLPDVEDHAAISCSSCHKFHSQNEVSETTPKVCKNCHHADIYECNTCHQV